MKNCPAYCGFCGNILYLECWDAPLYILHISAKSIKLFVHENTQKYEEVHVYFLFLGPNGTIIVTGNTGTMTGTGTGGTGTGTQGGMTGVGMVTSIPGSSFTGTGNTHFEIINYVIIKRIFINFTLYDTVYCT